MKKLQKEVKKRILLVIIIFGFFSFLYIRLISNKNHVLTSLQSENEDDIASIQSAWKKVKETLVKTGESIDNAKKQNIKQYLNKFKQNAVVNKTTFFVKESTEISQGERQFLRKRFPIVKKSLEKFLGRSLDNKYVPKIALVASGGGYRTMIGSMGSIIGADEIGLLDSSLWLVSLSGSTWFVNPWIVSELSPRQYQNMTTPLISNKDLQDITVPGLKLLIKSLITKFAFNEKITPVDFYGGFLSNRFLSLFRKDPYKIFLSSFQKMVEEGKQIFPICTAAKPNKSNWWFEFDPYEIGSIKLGYFVPTEGFGRKFYRGRTINIAPEQNLGYLMGVYGSFFASDFKKMVTESMAEKRGHPILETILLEILEELHLSDKRVKPMLAQVFNYTYGMHSSPMSKEKMLNLMDAGIDFNMPYPPVSGEGGRRKADVIILLDHVTAQWKANNLKKSENYAKTRGLKFPHIDYTNVLKKSISVFKDENDPQTPVVIYMPLIRDERLWKKALREPQYKHLNKYLAEFDPEVCVDEGYCYTLNCDYTEFEIHQLSACAELNMKANKDSIVDAINWVIDQHPLDDRNTEKKRQRSRDRDSSSDEVVRKKRLQRKRSRKRKRRIPGRKGKKKVRRKIKKRFRRDEFI